MLNDPDFNKRQRGEAPGPQNLGPDVITVEELRQAAHDLRHHFHVLQTGLSLLKGLRDNEEKFELVLDHLGRSQREAAEIAERLMTRLREQIAVQSSGETC